MARVATTAAKGFVQLCLAGMVFISFGLCLSFSSFHLHLTFLFSLSSLSNIASFIRANSEKHSGFIHVFLCFVPLFRFLLYVVCSSFLGHYSRSRMSEKWFGRRAGDKIQHLISSLFLFFPLFIFAFLDSSHTTNFFACVHDFSTLPSPSHPFP